MNREIYEGIKVSLKDLVILYVGDLNRGRRLQQIIERYFGTMSIYTEADALPVFCSNDMPNLVILDDFPKSRVARSIYYRLIRPYESSILVLNDSPNRMKFFHANALSQIRIIQRDPEASEFISAVLELTKSIHPPNEAPRVDLSEMDYIENVCINLCNCQGMN